MSQLPDQPIIDKWETNIENGLLNVKWDTWKGAPANNARLLVDDQEKAQQKPESQDSESGQKGVFKVDSDAEECVVKVTLENDAGTITSVPFSIGGAIVEDVPEDVTEDEDDDDDIPEVREGMESFEYYCEHIEEFRTTDWYDFFSDNVSGDTGFEVLNYYMRVDGDVDLSKITETEGEHNPDNVNRVIRIMPKSKFTSTFHLTNEADKDFRPEFSYLNFLKAVAVVPGYAGDYKDYPADLKTDYMKDPDLAAKRFLATTLAHAVQETSNTGRADNLGDFKDKVPGTFAECAESGAQIPIESQLFGKGKPLYHLAKGNNYYGRGAKQLTYVDNYANLSMVLYGDFRLVAYPSLLEQDCCLPFLSSIVYALTPKSGLPACVEVMDGRWQQGVTRDNNPASAQDIATYNRDFPVTVVLINGGPEGHGNNDNWANTKVRIDSYNHFSTSDDLLDSTVKYDVEQGDKYDSVFDLYGTKENMQAAVGEEYYNQNYARPSYFDYNGGGMVAWETGLQIFGGSALKDVQEQIKQ